MKKLLFFLAACAVSLSTFAAITPAKSTLDFGTVSIKGLDYAEGELKLNVSWTGLAQYAHLFVEFQDVPAEGCAFFVDTDDLITEGSGHPKITEYEYTVSFLAEEAGTYTCKMRLYGTNGTTYDYDEAFVDLKVVVTNEAIAGKVFPCTRVTSLSDGDVIVFVNEDANVVAGPHNSTFLPEVSDNVTIDAAHGTATITEDAGFFTVGKSGSVYTFTSADNKLLGGDGKALKLGEGTTNWTVTFDENDAIVMPKSSSYPMQYNAGDARFKLYNDGSYASVQIYKKSGGAVEVTSKLEIDPSAINFGDLACSATKSVEINYTAENLEKDIKWQIIGADKADFEVTPSISTNRTSGKVTVTYKGTSTKSGSLAAALYYGTWNAKKDTMYNSFPISINLIKLNSIAFKQTTYEVLKGVELDLSGEVTFDPSDVSEKGLTWGFKNSESFATITDAGVFKATATGDRVVVAKSVLDENIQAQCTVKVSLPVATEVQLDKTALTLHKDEYYDITATIKPDGTEKQVKYENDNTAAVSIQKQSNGKFRITGKSFGSGTETANVKFYVDGKAEIYTMCVVTVEPVAVTSITFDESSVTVNKGSTLDMTTIMHINPEPGAARDNTVTYGTSDLDVAQVDGDGLLTALDEGTATITVSAGGKSGTIIVVVGAPKMFSKVYDPSQLGDKDTIILANASVMAGAFDATNKKMTPLTSGFTVTSTEAYSDDAQRLVININSKDTTLTLAGKTSKLSNPSGGDLQLNKANDTWQFKADGTDVYVINVGTGKYIGYNSSGQAFIRTYNSASYPKLFVFVRKYHAPATGVENVEAEKVPAQKMLHEGRIVILRDGVMYEIDGRRTE